MIILLFVSLLLEQAASFISLYKGTSVSESKMYSRLLQKRFPHNFNDHMENSDKIFPPSVTPLDLFAKDNSIMFWDNALTPLQCQTIIGDFEKSQDAHYRGGSYLNGEISHIDTVKKNTELSISEESESTFKWFSLDNLLTETVKKHLNLYQDANIILSTQQNPFGDEGFRMKRYLNDGTEHHAYHADTGHEISLDMKPKRIIAVLIYLNDVETGGETVFLTKNVAIKPVAGRIAMFPTCYSFVHAGRCGTLYSYSKEYSETNHFNKFILYCYFFFCFFYK